MGSDKIDAVVVDEEAIGSVNSHGLGAKILRGEGSLERYLAEVGLKDQTVCLRIIIDQTVCLIKRYV